MNIMICDDRQEELNGLEKLVLSYADMHPEYAVRLQCFSDSIEMSDCINEFGAPDIALLDICMPSVSGVDIAKEIKKIGDDSTDIVFLTTSTEYAVDAFVLHVHDYLIKPYSEKRLFETLDSIMEKRKQRLCVPITCGREIHLVDLYHILYMESKNHTVDIHLKSEKILSTRAALSDIKEMFPESDGFISVGASYVVNLRFVRSILQNELVMTNGESIPIPRRLKNDIREQYFDFYMREAIEK